MSHFLRLHLLCQSSVSQIFKRSYCHSLYIDFADEEQAEIAKPTECRLFGELLATVEHFSQLCEWLLSVEGLGWDPHGSVTASVPLGSSHMARGVFIKLPEV